MSPERGRARSARRSLVVSVIAGLHASLARGLAVWLERAAPRSARGAVDIALVGDARMRRLNREYRQVDSATDVLSFPAAGSDSQALAETAADRALRPLGDIAIAAGVARRQARDHGHSLGVELKVLALHGLLHLLGYDHDADAGEMRRLEERLRRRARLPVGLIARVPLSHGRHA